MPRVKISGDKVVIQVANGGSMTGDLMVQWFVQCLQPQLSSPQSPGVLMLDRASSHKHPVFLKYLKMNSNITPVFIPAKTTHMLQPLDVGVMSPFKSSLKRSWEAWQADPNPIMTKRGNRKRPSYEHVCNWVLRAMEDLRPDLVSKSFTVIV